MRVQRALLSACALLLSCVLSACAPSVPPRWAEGGAGVQILPAHWERGDDDSVEIKPNGQVLEGGHLRFVIDRVGRVTDDDYEPFAVLMPDGHLIGNDDRALGYVGLSNASPPFADHAWLGLQPDGRVLFYAANGDRSEHGRWTGCDGPGRRACTLVTQLFVMRNYRVMPNSGVTFGVGVGVGMGF